MFVFPFPFPRPAPERGLGGTHGPLRSPEELRFRGRQQPAWGTDWISFPAGFKNAQLVIVTKSRIGTSSLAVQLQTTWDTDQVQDVGAAISTGAPAIQISNITADLGPMVRLHLSCASDCQVVVSVYLTPKSE